MTDQQTHHDDFRLPPLIWANAALMAVIALVLYLRTLHPGLGPSLDSIELQIAALVNGVIHPPGSPQYLVLGKLAMSILPGPTAAYRLNLFSAVMAMLAVAVVYLVSYRLTGNWIASTYASGSLAFAMRFWYQASIAELYTFNALYVALVILMLIVWRQSGRKGYFWAATAIYALSFGHHVSSILLLPAYLYVVWVTDRTMLLNPKRLGIVVGIVLLAAAQYFIIPARVAANPPFCNFCPSTARLPEYLSGGPFKSQMFALPLREVLKRLPDSFQQLAGQFMPWGVVLGVIGLWELFKERVHIAWFLFIGIVAEYVFVMAYLIPDWHDFLTPVYVLFAPMLGLGGLRVWERVEPRLQTFVPDVDLLKGYALPAALIGGIALNFATLAWSNIPPVDQSARTEFEDNGRRLLEAADQGAVLIMPKPDSPAFYYGWALSYLSMLEGGDSPHLITAMSAEVDPPPGPAPYYRSWAETAPLLEDPTTLIGAPQTFVLDLVDARLTGLGMLPVCQSDGEIIVGYEVVGIVDGDQIVPLVDDGLWDAIQPYVVRAGEEAVCP